MYAYAGLGEHYTRVYCNQSWRLSLRVHVVIMPPPRCVRRVQILARHFHARIQLLIIQQRHMTVSVSREGWADLVRTRSYAAELSRVGSYSAVNWVVEDLHAF